MHSSKWTNAGLYSTQTDNQKSCNGQQNLQLFHQVPQFDHSLTQNRFVLLLSISYRLFIIYCPICYIPSMENSSRKGTRQDSEPITDNDKSRRSSNQKNTGRTTLQPTQTRREQQFQTRDYEYRELKWFCPCGELMMNPIHFFHHVKTTHADQSLEQVIRLQMIESFTKNYPNNTLNEFINIESLDDTNINSTITSVASSYTLESFPNNYELPQPQHKGTYTDLATHFVGALADTPLKRLLLNQFFMFLRHFVVHRFGIDCWQYQSPKDILKLANNMLTYFQSITMRSTEEFGPLTSVHVQKLIKCLGKWMYLNKWTNDRLIDSTPDDGDFDDSTQPAAESQGNQHHLQPYHNF